MPTTGAHGQAMHVHVASKSIRLLCSYSSAAWEQAHTWRLYEQGPSKMPSKSAPDRPGWNQNSLVHHTMCLLMPQGASLLGNGALDPLCGIEHALELLYSEGLAHKVGDASFPPLLVDSLRKAGLAQYQV